VDDVRYLLPTVGVQVDTLISRATRVTQRQVGAAADDLLVAHSVGEWMTKTRMIGGRSTGSDAPIGLG
jgi:hypothetical protein